MLLVMDESILEKNISQLLQTYKEQFIIAITFLTGYNGIFNVTSKNNNFTFTVSVNDDCVTVITLQRGAIEYGEFK